jgi:hypothetical protein
METHNFNRKGNRKTTVVTGSEKHQMITEHIPDKRVEEYKSERSPAHVPPLSPATKWNKPIVFS